MMNQGNRSCFPKNLEILIMNGNSKMVFTNININPHFKYCFSKDAIVETLPAAGLRAFIQQRIRWASKSTSYQNKNIKLVLLLVYLVNLSIMMMLLGGFYDLQYLRWGLLFILIKTIFEYPFMIRTARFFGKQNLLPWFIIAQPFHIVYIVLSASLSFFKRYEWKGRLTVNS